MRMVPATPILPRPPSVVEGAARSNWTLRNPIDAVHVRRVKLSDTMPVDACPIMLEMIRHDDGYRLLNS